MLYDFTRIDKELREKFGEHTISCQKQLSEPCSCGWGKVCDDFREFLHSAITQAIEERDKEWLSCIPDKVTLSEKKEDFIFQGYGRGANEAIDLIAKKIKEKKMI